MSEESKYCPECGRKVGAGAAMCPDCGHMFNTGVFNQTRQSGTGHATNPVLSEGLMMIFIGILIELASPALGFAGAGSIPAAIGSFIGVGGMIVELLGFAKIRHVNHHFNKAWNYYIGAIACSIGYAIVTIIMTVVAVSAMFTGGVGVVIALLIISIGFTIALGVLDIFRIRELMNGCAEVAAESGDAALSEKCSFAGSFYGIARGILLAITTLVLILTLAYFASFATGLLVAAGIFGIILIIISCVLLAAQILVIVRIYQSYSKYKMAGGSAGTGAAGNYNNAGQNPNTGKFSESEVIKQSYEKSEEKAPEAAKSVHERVDELEKKLAGTGAGAAGAASGFGASVAKARAATPAAAKPVKEDNKDFADTEDPVTMLKHPDVELELIQGKATDNDDEKTVLLTGAAPALVNLSTGERIEITSDTFTLGRSREKVDFRIENPAVSVTHAKISKSNGKCFIEDLNSSNHTYVNGRMLEPGEAAKSELNDGDTVKLAEVEFKWEKGSSEPAGAVQNATNSVFIARIDKTGEEAQISNNKITLGRKGGSADIKVGDSNTLGRIHASIRADEENGKAFIKDDDSANGTFVNGKRLEKGEEVEIKNNDDIMLSDVTVKFKIR